MFAACQSKIIIVITTIIISTSSTTLEYYSDDTVNVCLSAIMVVWVNVILDRWIKWLVVLGLIKC